MSLSHARDAVKYNVVVHPVQEVSLIGSADLAYWRERLSAYALHPTVASGLAEMLISAASARFMRKAFRELSFSVFVSDVDGGDRRDGAFMIHAFNSSRMFAWVERTFFHTPYYPGGLEVSALEPPRIRLHDGHATVFRAEFNGRAAGSTRSPLRVAEDGWEGPIHLPSKSNRAGEPHRLFHARLAGMTRVVEFNPSLDVWEVDSRADHRLFDILATCDFKPLQWHIRAAATHSKSKTSIRGK